MKDPLISAGMVTVTYIVIMVFVCALMGLADQRRIEQRPRRAISHWWLYTAAMAAAIVASVVCPMGWAAP